MILKKTLKSIYIKSVWAMTNLSEQRVVFSSFLGNSYSDNPKAISEKLHELAPELEIIWVYNGRALEGVPEYVHLVNRQNRSEYYKTLASAKVIVENFGFDNIPKKSGQIYIQTWHGDRAFKKVLYDSPFAGDIIVPESKSGFCDLAIAGSDYGERQYRSAFRYSGEVLKEGTPRDDVLFRVTMKLIHEKMQSIGINKKYKYLLYAPTLRRANQHTDVKQNIQGINICETLSSLEAKYGGEWKCLLRAHPGVRGLTGDGVNDEKVIDVSKYPDMTDLMIVSDALITDYSSTAGDFALLRRPIFLFQDDIEEYQKKDRTFYFEMSDSPYLIAHSQEELNGVIAKTSVDDAVQNCNDILDFYGTHESGNSARIIAERIREYCGIKAEMKMFDDPQVVLREVKKAVIIGGSNGIGLAITKCLIENDCFVHILDRHEPEEGILPAEHYKYHYCNLLDIDEELIAFLADDSDIKLLMITAGFGRVADFDYFHPVEIKNMMTVNATATIQILRLFYDRIKGNKNFFCGVMGSISGLMSSPSVAVYAASKAAICRFIESVNIELEKADTENRILNVSPASFKGSCFYGGKNQLDLLEKLSYEILERLIARETLYIPQYEETFRAVLERYHNNPHEYGLHSYQYKKDSGRLDNNRRVNVGYLSGTFDLFHVGHLNLLRRAKQQCDFLIVGVHDSGAWKGKETFVPLEERKAIVGACKYVDKVVDSCREDSDAWDLWHYDKLFVGSDYKGTERFKRYEEYFKDKGVEIVYFPYTQSTSSTQIRKTIMLKTKDTVDFGGGKNNCRVIIFFLISREYDCKKDLIRLSRPAILPARRAA